ncbi:MAG: thermonuclease family protein [Firmicutes bacterium]|nr:thermonuclease family protein [Bacillota bacterium]
MKKIVLYLLSFIIIATLTACNPKDDPIIDEVDTTLYTTFTDELVMDVDYASKNFITDGIGQVTLVSCTDGDTARFSNGTITFAVRFLAIDTPESTYKFDPWGKSASVFTCDKLTNATTIVLESDAPGPAVTDGNERYLAWVWYDGRLLNLELIEQAFSVAKGAAGSRYEEIIYAAEIKTQLTKRHIWGEADPDYDYSLEGVQITIEELVTNQSQYIGQKVVITGIITSTIAGHPYLESNGYGVYVYLGYVYTTKAETGNEVTLSGVNPTYYPDAETGALQLVGFNRKNIVVISTDNEIVPTLKEVKDLTINDVGSYIKVEGIEVVSIYTSNTTGDHTVTCKDSLGNIIDVHVQSGVTRTEVNNMFVVGSLIDVVAPLGRYMEIFQLEIETLDGVNSIE